MSPINRSRPLLIVAVFLATTLGTSLWAGSAGGDSPLLTVVVLAIPLLFGFAIGRWWAVIFAIVPATLLVIVAASGEVGREPLSRSLWFLLLLVLHAALMGLGVTAKVVARRASPRTR